MFLESALATSRTFLDRKLCRETGQKCRDSCGQLPGTFDIQKLAEEPTGEEEEDEEGRWGFLELPVELFILMTWVPLLDDGYQTYGC